MAALICNRPLLAALTVVAVAAAGADWSVVLRERTSLPPGPTVARAVRYTPGGVKIAIDQDQRRIYRMAPESATAEVFQFDAARLTGTGQTQVLLSVGIGTHGEILVPIAWRSPGRNSHFGIVAISGASQHLIELQPPVEIRDLAMESSGAYYVTGVDPAFFRRENAGCFLLHKYSPQGKRVASFSPCPHHGAGEDTPLRRNGIDFELLREDLDSGKIWLEGPMLVQTLARQHEVRRFALDGAPAGCVRIEPPHDASGARLHGYFETREGRLALWRVLSASGPGQRSGRMVVSRHDDAGAMIGSARPVSDLMAGPVFVDADGRCVFRQRGLRNGREVLLTAQVR